MFILQNTGIFFREIWSNLSTCFLSPTTSNFQCFSWMLIADVLTKLILDSLTKLFLDSLTKTVSQRFRLWFLASELSCICSENVSLVMIALFLIRVAKFQIFYMEENLQTKFCPNESAYYCDNFGTFYSKDDFGEQMLTTLSIWTVFTKNSCIREDINRKWRF